MNDWVNLPQGTDSISLWDSLHDAHVVSIRSNLLDRTLVLFFEIEHLRRFHHLPEGFQFIVCLEGVQSARVLHHAIWPGDFSVPSGVSRDEESRLVKEYQAKWREESASWNEFETSIAREIKQIFNISDAELVATQEALIVLRLNGHLTAATNHATYHEVFLRAERLNFSGSDGKTVNLDDFRKLGGSYWEAFSIRKVKQGRHLNAKE